MNRMFRRTARTISAIASLTMILYGQPSFAAPDPPGPAQAGKCSTASVKGAYGLNLQGTSDTLGRFVSISLLTFDGKGGFSGTETFSSETTGPQTRPVTGTDTVQDDCSFSLSEESNIAGTHGADARCVLVDNGKQFYCVDFESGWQLLIVGSRI